MNYEEALNYIHGTYKFGIKLGLDNIGKLLDYMGNPQDKLSFVHLAGTNGKGSTSNMISSVLRESGYKIGLFISPYLEEFTERIQVDGRQIPKADLARITAFVKSNVEKMLAQGYAHPTEFEVVTAVGFQYFYEENVDFVVLEVGMGGRFDATNVIKTPEVAVITSISMDHMQYLGTTIEEITFEKAGIIKENGKVVLYPQGDNVEKVIEDVCSQRSAALYKSDDSKLKLLDTSLSGQKLAYTGSDVIPAFEFNLSLLGDHQVKNCITALTAIEVLIKNGYNISTEDIQMGLKKITFPGRFEVLSKSPTIIIDGAHNEDGIKSLVASVKKYVKTKVVLVLGVLADKDFNPMISELVEISDKIYTVTPNNPRAMKSSELAMHISENYPNVNVHVKPLDSIREGATLALNGRKDEVFVFVGSLYMIGEARTAIKSSLK